MDTEYLEKETALLEKQLKREKGNRIVLIVAIVGLTFGLITKNSETKIVLQPTGSQCKESFVSDTTASKDYLIDLTEDVIQMRFNFSPETAEKHFDEILTMVAPSDFGVMQKFVAKELERVKKNNISSVFYPKEYQIDIENSKVVVTGRLINFSGERKVLDEKRTYRIDYKIEDNFASLVGLIDVTGTRDPMNVMVSEGGSK
jgi:type IV conjugative transfer system protein TraE